MADKKESLCESCGREIIGEPKVVILSREKSQFYSGKTKQQIFHQTVMECANAKDSYKIVIAKAARVRREWNSG